MRNPRCSIGFLVLDKDANLCSRTQRWKMCLVHDATSNRLARKHTDFSLAGALRDAHRCSPKKLHRRDNVTCFVLRLNDPLEYRNYTSPILRILCILSSRCFFFCASGSKLQALAWNGATSTVQEAVAGIEAGRPRPRLFTESTLTIADAITLRQLGGSMEETIAKLIDHDKRSAKPNATKSRVSYVAKAARAGVHAQSSGSTPRMSTYRNLRWRECSACTTYYAAARVCESIVRILPHSNSGQ